MPKLIYSAGQGLRSSSGEGFSVGGSGIKPGSSEAATYTGAKYEITTRADVGDDLDGKYFIIYDQAGVSYAWWFDVDDSGTPEPAAAAAADNSYVITTVVTADADTVVATKVGAAIDTNAGTKFEAIVASAVVSTYVLAVGAMTTTTIDAGTSGFTLALTDSTTGTSIPAVPKCQATVTAGTDVATVQTEIPLDDGTNAGQEKFILVAATSAGQIVLTGNFCNGSTVGTKLTFDASTGAANGLYMVWNGGSWFVVNMMSTQAVS